MTMALEWQQTLHAGSKSIVNALPRTKARRWIKSADTDSLIIARVDGVLLVGEKCVRRTSRARDGGLVQWQGMSKIYRRRDRRIGPTHSKQPWNEFALFAHGRRRSGGHERTK
jgi:hypothetical protein